jgi:hypothetical protein
MNFWNRETLSHLIGFFREQAANRMWNRNRME